MQYNEWLKNEIEIAKKVDSKNLKEYDAVLSIMEQAQKMPEKNDYLIPTVVNYIFDEYSKNGEAPAKQQILKYVKKDYERVFDEDLRYWSKTDIKYEFKNYIDVIYDIVNKELKFENPNYEKMKQAYFFLTNKCTITSIAKEEFSKFPYYTSDKTVEHYRHTRGSIEKIVDTNTGKITYIDLRLMNPYCYFITDKNEKIEIGFHLHPEISNMVSEKTKIYEEKTTYLGFNEKLEEIIQNKFKVTFPYSESPIHAFEFKVKIVKGEVKYNKQIERDEAIKYLHIISVKDSLNPLNNKERIVNEYYSYKCIEAVTPPEHVTIPERNTSHLIKSTRFDFKIAESNEELKEELKENNEKMENSIKQNANPVGVKVVEAYVKGEITADEIDEYASKQENSTLSESSTENDDIDNDSFDDAE